MSTKGLVIVLSAPSGAGKTSLCQLLMRRRDTITYSISCTTRPRRPGEKDGRDYFFVTEKQFLARVKRNAFVEWARVHGHYYGTPKSQLRKVINSGKDIVLDIDVQGGRSIRRTYPGAVMVFIMTPTFAELERRLRARNKDTDEVICRRLKNARREVKELPRYDYLVINDDLKRAARELDAIITAEHRRLAHAGRPSFNGQ